MSSESRAAESRASAKFRREFCDKVLRKFDKVIDEIGPDEWNRTKKVYVDAWISTVDIDSRGDPLGVSAHYRRVYDKLHEVKKEYPYVFVYHWYDKVNADLCGLPKALLEIDQCYDMMCCEMEEIKRKQGIPPEKKQKTDE